MLVRFLMARRFDVDRSYALLFKFPTRFELKGKLTATSVMTLLKTQRIIMPPCRDRFGSGDFYDYIFFLIRFDFFFGYFFFFFFFVFLADTETVPS